MMFFDYFGRYAMKTGNDLLKVFDIRGTGGTDGTEE